MWNRGLRASQLWIHVGLVGGVVVADDVDVEFVGDGLVDAGQEIAELYGAVAAVTSVPCSSTPPRGERLTRPGW
jgi:hypothetical protein